MDPVSILQELASQSPLPEMPQDPLRPDAIHQLMGIGLSFTGLLVFAFVGLMLGMFVIPLLIEIARRIRQSWQPRSRLRPAHPRLGYR